MKCGNLRIACLTVAVSHFFGATFTFASVGDSYIATWKGNAKAAYSLTTDDDHPSQVYSVAPALTERGLHGTFYINPGAPQFSSLTNIGDVNGDGKPDGYAHLPEQGHELGSHTMQHWTVTPGYSYPGYPNSVFSSYDAVAADCDLTNSTIFNLTGQRVVSFAYPWGWYDAGSEAVMAQKYLSARALLHTGSNGNRYYPNPATPPDMYTLWCFYVEGVTNGVNFDAYNQAIAAYTKMLNDTVTAGGWGIEFFHNTGGDNINPFSDWGAVDKDAYLQHLDNIEGKAQAGQIWQDTVGNVTRYIDSRNAASITYDSITDTSIQLHVTDGLDRSLFDVPLTINTVVPSNWASNLQITDGGQSINFTTYLDTISGNTYARFDVLADGMRVIISQNSGGGSHLPGSIPGDYNGDNVVDAADYVVWRQSLGSTTELAADGNNDGVVDQGDYDIWRQDFAQSCAPPNGMSISISNVPEPSTWAYMMLGGAQFQRITRRARGWRKREIDVYSDLPLPT